MEGVERVGRAEVRLRRRGGRGDALGAREGNGSVAGGRERFLKAQGSRKEQAVLPTEWSFLRLTGR